ncbi:MAG: XRE family transcriptional regulator [Flavobacteriales bacterium]|nr:transcriptional regulator [Flavobacteriaceae bacterium]RZP08712.1 MAG: XRE family transcriptional regulator [Flavobacteriales bacterium]
MVYMNDFTEKLKKIIQTEGLTASKFAEKIGVQRSSVSHVLSGRNKPSLDFILKINKSIDNISLDWLLDNENDVNETSPTPTKNIKAVKNHKNESMIEKIIIFFNDGTFKIYKN